MRQTSKPTVFQSRYIHTLLAAGALAATSGCVNSKDVNLATQPNGATLTVTRLQASSSPTPFPLPSEQTTSPATIHLQFPEGVSYEIEARKPQYFPNKIHVAYDPDEKHDYTIPLTQYEKNTPGISYVPTGSTVRRLVPRVVPAIGYLVPDTEPEKNPDLTQPRQLTLYESGGVEVDYPCLAASPSEDLLAFQRVERQPDGHWVSKIYKVSTQGGSPVRVTTSDAQEFTPAFNRNGDYVIFSSDNISENPTLWKIKTSGGGTAITSLTRTDALDYQPSASQQTLAYTSIPPRAAHPQIWEARHDGTQPSYITAGTCPQVSPDGRNLLFLRPGKDGHQQLWRVDIDGGNLTQLTQNTGYDIAGPRWKPDDGKWIIYSSTEAVDPDGNHNADLWLIPADGSRNKIQLTYNGSSDDAPVWDRNGHTIYFRSNRGGTWAIWRADITNAQVVTTTRP